jgi:hypothetical protein
MNRFVVALASLSLALFACRGDDGGGNTGDDDTGSDGGAGSDGHVVAGTVTIKQVQDDAMASGTQIELKGVIVTAVDTYGAKTGDIYVEDADGGAFSGVKVFGAPLDVVATLAVGDKIDITNAQKNEFACTGTICGTGTFDPGFSVTEVESVNGGDLSIVKTGTGAVPAPSVVDALAISMMTADQQNAEWEKWEGVYIKVIHARQTNAITMFGAHAADQQSFGITSTLPHGVNVESVLAPFSTDAVVGTCFDGITGIGDYFFEYLVLPTAMTGTAGGGTGCSTLTTTTVAAVQMGTVTGGVTLQNLVITARDDVGSNMGFWAADAAQSAQYNGIYVYTGGTLDATYVVGATVNVVGTVTEFDVAPAAGDTLTEIKNATVTVVSGTATPLPAATTAAVAGDITNGEPFEDVLVKMTGLKVTAATASGKTELTDNAGTKITLYGDAFATLPMQTVGTCFKSITGIMSVELTSNVRTINPRSATDLEAGVAGTDCN